MQIRQLKNTSRIFLIMTAPLWLDGNIRLVYPYAGSFTAPKHP